MAGWIGVDLDGTLAQYGGWQGPDHIGEPIAPMVARVKEWLAAGREVRIFTARVGASGDFVSESQMTDCQRFAEQQRELIQSWCERHLGQRLAVTATKDYGMVELWDDRAVQVIPNTGMTVREFLTQ